MLDQESQARVFGDLSEGDVVEAGDPFLFAPGERLTWRCVGVESLKSGEVQYTFHVHFMGVVVRAACAVVAFDKKHVRWVAV